MLNSIDNFNFRNCVDICNMTSKLKELDEQAWKSVCVNKPKLRTYVKFKSVLCPENYVKFCASRKMRSFLAQIRLGILPLKIETGRFTGVKADERFCDLCKTLVEDEEHFVFVCPNYEVLRAEVLKLICVSNNEFQLLDNYKKFHYMFNEKWKEIGKFLLGAWEKRQNSLYHSAV